MMEEYLVRAVSWVIVSWLWYTIGKNQGVKSAKRDARESDHRYQESLKSWKGEKCN